MDAYIDKIVRFNTLNVVGVFRKEEGDLYYVLKLRKKNSKLEVVALESFAGFEELKKHTDTKIPIIILIDGKGVLNKKIDPKNEIDLNWIKNLDYTSIHHTTYSSEGLRFLSFCRRNVAEESITLLQNSGFEVIDLYIGPIVAVLLKDSLNKEQLYANGSLLELQENDLTDILKSKQPAVITTYEIGETTVSNYHLPLYGAAVHFYIRQRAIEKSTAKGINREEIIYKTAFKTVGLIMIALFFVLLLISYSLTWYYNTQNAELNMQNVYSNQSYKIIQGLEVQSENKLRILNETGFLSSKFISFYGYELTKSTPAEISISGLEIFPLTKEIKGNEKVSFTSKVINIKGSTYNEAVFNSWLKRLKIIEWIDNFEIISLKKDKKELSHFELKITLKNV